MSRDPTQDPHIPQFRYFLKDSIRQRIDFSQTPQALGYPPPPVQKPCDPTAKRVELVRPGTWKGIRAIPVETAIRNRESRREFTRDSLTLDELSFLLWATQGLRAHISPGTTLRTVPSAGARHALETYLVVFRVEGLEEGVYRYLPLEHQLVFEFAEPDLRRKLVDGALGQRFVGEAAVVFVWTTIPYRMEWRYHLAAHKAIALDAGHVCQNLYLACEAIEAGTCAVAAYHQEKMDRLLRVDGEDEFVIYLAPVGKRRA